MSNQIFHFSNSGISSGQRFYLKDDVSGIFVRNLNIDSNFPVVASNLVYNTGNQIISGVKTFATGIIAPNLVYTTGYQQIDGNKVFIGSPFQIDNGLSLSITSGGIYTQPNATYFNNNNDINFDFGHPYLNTRLSIGYNTGILRASINSQNNEREIKIYETGGFMSTLSYGPYLRMGRSGILISETSENKVGIGTLFPQEKVHISGGNLRVDGNVSANNLNNLVYTTGNQIISGVKNFTNNLVIQDNILFSSQPSGYLTGVGYSGNYDGGYFLGRTKLSQNTSRLIDSSFGNTWVAKESSRFWNFISISSDGKYQSATVGNGQIYISSDYGNSWVAKESSRFWNGISISSDGKYQSAVVGNGQIYVSSDYGNSWVAKESSRFWSGISISSDGKYQSAVVSSGQIYVSSDYGNSWVAKESSRVWNGISISSDGKYQTAVGGSGQIYVSSDYGNSWVAKESSRSWIGISISSDGKYQTAVVSSGQIYVSSDYGNSWVAKESSRLWRGISISSDGKYQTAVVISSGQIYVSSDYGNSWVAKESSRSWIGISISSDGKYQSATANGGQIYTSKTDEQIDGNLYADNLVYITGNQNISEIKNFYSRPTVNGTGVLLSGEAGSSLITIQDEGSSQGSASTLNFVGAGVSVSVAGSTGTITINGGGGGGISFVSPPATPNTVGTSGQMALDQNYAYYCISNNNWRRSAISSW